MELESSCRALLADSIASLPGFVRLAFHDCVGPNGCDGCIDMNNGDNSGWYKYII